jgi:hypothetical protein
MPTHYLCASKEINGGIYITRMSVPSMGGEPGFAPGTDDGEWYFVGPGSRPSVQHYSGLTQFILTFDFLSHLTTRVIDISTWPPTIINPISQGASGGPNTTNKWTPNTMYLTGSQVKDPNNHVQQAIAGGVSAVGSSLTNIQIASNTIAVTVPNSFVPTQVVAFGNMMTATFLNGVEVTVATAGPNSFTATYTHPNYPSTPDAGNVSVIPAWNDAGGNTTDNTVTWHDEGVAQPFAQVLSTLSDASAIQLRGEDGAGTVDNFFNPPLVDRSLLFFNGLTNSYSVTLSLDPGWVPLLKPSGVTAFFRLYRRAIGTLPWLLLMDWTPNTFSFVDTSVGSLRFQYSATWGDLFLPSDPNNPAKHAEGVPGFYVVTVDSTVEHPSFQFQPFDFLTLKFSSTMEYGAFDQRQLFITEAPFDTIGFPVSSVGIFGEHPSNAMEYATFGPRAGAIAFAVPTTGGVVTPDEILAPFSGGPSNYYGSMSAPADMT